MIDWRNHAGPWREWRAAITSSRMHHGWILAGKKGLGKRDFAVAAARELVAEEGIPQPPGEHPDIMMVTHGPKDKKAVAAQDAGKEFERARSIRIEQIRDMQRRLSMRPTLGRRRAVIINPADDMERATSNALLKSLEEPPQGTFFLLVTHSPARLLPTIRSRCRLLRFPIICDADLETMLEQHGAAEESETRMAAIRAAQGSFGAALQFAEQGLAPVADTIERLLTRPDLDLKVRNELAHLIGPRADRERLQAVFALAQSTVVSRARNSDDSTHRATLIEAYGALVALSAQAPAYNFDTGLLALEIGSLLTRAAPASERAHG